MIHYLRGMNLITYCN